MLNDVRLGITQVSEDVVIEEESSFVDTCILLALTAHAKDGLELLQLIHDAFSIFF